jgi:U3 small nucleolar RNA-associated protein 24
MGVQKKTRKFGAVKRVISQRDARIKKNIMKNESDEKKKKEQGDNVVRDVYVCQR